MWKVKIFRLYLKIEDIVDIEIAFANMEFLTKINLVKVQ